MVAWERACMGLRVRGSESRAEAAGPVPKEIHTSQVKRLRVSGFIAFRDYCCQERPPYVNEREVLHRTTLLKSVCLFYHLRSWEAKIRVSMIRFGIDCRI